MDRARVERNRQRNLVVNSSLASPDLSRTRNLAMAERGDVSIAPNLAAEPRLSLSGEHSAAEPRLSLSGEHSAAEPRLSLSGELSARIEKRGDELTGQLRADKKGELSEIEELSAKDKSFKAAIEQSGNASPATDSQLPRTLYIERDWNHKQSEDVG
jgi:hypothetical protein